MTEFMKVCAMCRCIQPRGQFLKQMADGSIREMKCCADCREAYRIKQNQRRAREREEARRAVEREKNRPPCHLCGQPVSRYLWCEIYGHTYCVECGQVMREAIRETPWTRADCKDLPKPCTNRGCRYHLSAGETRTQPDGCVLDIIDERGPCTLDRVGQDLGVTRERVRQVQEKATRRLKIWCRENKVDFEEVTRCMDVWWEMDTGTYSARLERRREKRRLSRSESTCEDRAGGM